jgi:hypothetical protein
MYSSFECIPKYKPEKTNGKWVNHIFLLKEINVTTARQALDNDCYKFVTIVLSFVLSRGEKQNTPATM